MQIRAIIRWIKLYLRKKALRRQDKSVVYEGLLSFILCNYDGLSFCFVEKRLSITHLPIVGISFWY